jgi:stage V sporulation protein R
VRTTSLFFQPQIRTKIMNEGWASYWHEKLFLQDDRIRGHEVDFARVHAMVTAVPRVGMNPYALGMRLFQHIESTADRGRYSIAYGRLADVHERKIYDEGGDGRALIFQLRADLNDFLFLNRFVDQEFINRHRLFVTGRRLNQQRQVWEYYVKSRKVEDYRQMLLEALYHPPHVTIDSEKGNEETLYLVHHFEGKPLVREYIAGVLLGLEYLWGDRVQLETSEPVEEERADSGSPQSADDEEEEAPLEWQRVLYTMKNRKLARQVLS